MDNADKKGLIEAALFISSEPLSAAKLAHIVGIEPARVREYLAELREDLERDGRGIELAKVGTGYEFRVRPEYMNKISHLTPYSDLTRGQLKALAIIAFKQPVTQSDIVKTIGNRTYEYIKYLEQRKLIKSQRWKRTKKLATTEEFNRYFGINSKNLNKLKKQIIK
jgi:segregation and condensation protein B